MMRSWFLSLPVLFLAFAFPLQAQSPPHGLRLRDGFEAAEFADNSLANDIFCMTIDPKGRAFVSGRGYIRLLVDDNGDGRADRALEFAGAPKDGAMGLFWEGDNLFCIGDCGLRCYRDANVVGHNRSPQPLRHSATLPRSTKILCQLVPSSDRRHVLARLVLANLPDLADSSWACPFSSPSFETTGKGAVSGVA